YERAAMRVTGQTARRSASPNKSAHHGFNPARIAENAAARALAPRIINGCSAIVRSLHWASAPLSTFPPGDPHMTQRAQSAIAFLVAAFAVTALIVLRAEPPSLKPPALKSPQEEKATFQLHPGFRIELVACEPQIVDPVAMTFDQDGRLYV